MRHVVTIAERELRSLFVSPVAYVVLTLWSVLAGTFFLASLSQFQTDLLIGRQFQQIERLAQMNLNDSLISPFLGAMWFVMLFLLPAVTMGLFANDKTHGTEELLLTSPLSIWEIVVGKFVAGAAFATIMTLIAALFPALLMVYGDPDVGQTAAGFLGLLLVSFAYVSVGGFASSLTGNQLIAFVIALVLLLVVGVLLPVLVEINLGGAGVPFAEALGALMRWVATGPHFERLISGVVDTSDLSYFVVVIGTFLVLTKTIVESSRWR